MTIHLAAVQSYDSLKQGNLHRSSELRSLQSHDYDLDAWQLPYSYDSCSIFHSCDLHSLPVSNKQSQWRSSQGVAMVITWCSHVI